MTGAAHPYRPGAQTHRPVRASYDLTVGGERVLVYVLGDGRRHVMLGDLAAIVGSIPMGDVEALPVAAGLDVAMLQPHGRTTRPAVSVAWILALGALPEADVPASLARLWRAVTAPGGAA